MQCKHSTFKTCFQQVCRHGIHEYFLQLKILYAKILLSNGMDVKEVAEKMSFSSQNYFSVVFKRKVGISPLQYKKKNPWNVWFISGIFNTQHINYNIRDFNCKHFFEKTFIKSAFYTRKLQSLFTNCQLKQVLKFAIL